MTQSKSLSVPKGWQWVPFGSCAKLINGRAYKQSELLSSGTPVLRIQNLNRGDRWYYSDLSLPEEKYCQKGDLLYAWSATFGPYLWTGPRCIYHYHIWKIEPEPHFDKLFGYYLLQWISKAVKQAAHGITMVHMTKEGMESWLIPLPPLEEQCRIAAILDKADAVRRKRQQAIALTEELLRSAFLEMFGDPDTNPKGWEVVKIEDVANVKTGKTPSRDDPANFGGNIRWVKTTEVRNNIIEQTEEHLTEKGVTQMTVFPENSILVAMYGQGVTRGRTALLGCPCATNQACAVILPNKQYCSIYLWTLLKLSYNRLRELGRGGNQPNLNLSMVKDFSIALPPLEKQARFRAFASTLHLESNKLIESQKFHNNLFNSLLQRAFRGEL